MKSKIGLLVILIMISLASVLYLVSAEKEASPRETPLKLYWFIPDGFRADPDVFQVFEWAQAGELPNIQKMMENGSWGYSVPVFPGHTPTNFATLLTGSTPQVHGVADGPMRLPGYPLKMVSVSGFSSVAKKVPPIWYTLEERGHRVALLSVPGSTPPELNDGVTIKGRWGGWGIDFPSLIFHSAEDRHLRKEQKFGNRVFFFGPNLTTYVSPQDAGKWQLKLPTTFSPPQEVDLSAWGQALYGWIYDSKDDGRENYDRILFSLDKKSALADLAVGDWSEWAPVELSYQTGNDYNLYTPKKMDWERKLSEVSVNTQIKLKVIALGERGFFRIRQLYDGMNEFLVKPSYWSEAIHQAVGPMVDFVDNYPAQLVYHPEDKQTFIEEANLSMDWHRRMAAFMTREIPGEFFIHNIYTPNQMLTSRWWMGAVDPQSARYSQYTEEDRQKLWQEVKNMYRGIDAIIGEALKVADENTLVVLASDHGAVPLNQEVFLNNFFAQKGWLKFAADPRTGEYQIDWGRTKVIYLKMDNVYINPKGLAGNYRRAGGDAYEKLRGEVIQALSELQGPNGEKVVTEILKWEQAGELNLPQEQVGDLVVANRAGFGWVEDVTETGEIFSVPTVAGYKQAVMPRNEKGMWTPFVIMGPGVKKNFHISRPIQHIQQYPTIMRALREDIPEFVEGQPLEEIFNN